MRITDLHPTKIWNSTQRVVNYRRNYHLQGIRVDGPPVFLVGFSHSGTSISLAVLGAHSRLHAIPFESKILVKKNRATFDRALKRFDKRAIAAGKHRWIEKSPHHIDFLEELLDWSPDAQVVFVIRDGRDVAASLKKRTGNLKRAIENWTKSNRNSQVFWNHPRVHLFKYEDLITDFDTTLRQITDFLGEEFEPEMRNYHETPRKFYSLKIQKPENAFGKNHTLHRNWQINQPLFDGRGRWKSLSADEIDLLDDVAGDFLSELGYLEGESSRAAA